MAWFSVGVEKKKKKRREIRRENTYASSTGYNVLEQASNDFSIMIFIGNKASDEHAEERMLCGVERATDRHPLEARNDRDQGWLYIWVTTWFPTSLSGSLSIYILKP